MRNSSKTEWIEDWGIHLEAAGCAEHERYIDPLNRDFGIDAPRDKNGFYIGTVLGSDRYNMTHIPIGFDFMIRTRTITRRKTKYKFKEAILAYRDPSWSNTEKPLKKLYSNYEWYCAEMYQKIHGEEEFMRSEWDEREFLIFVRGEDNIAKLKAIYDAFIHFDGSITTNGNSNPFSRGGLNILISSKIPKEYRDFALKTDTEQAALRDASNATGIIDKLRNAYRGFYACSPRIDKNGEMKYFLNPHDQQKYNHGWFTVEELEQWIDNKGPVLK